MEESGWSTVTCNFLRNFTILDLQRPSRRPFRNEKSSWNFRMVIFDLILLTEAVINFSCQLYSSKNSDVVNCVGNHVRNYQENYMENYVEKYIENYLGHYVETTRKIRINYLGNYIEKCGGNHVKLRRKLRRNYIGTT